MWKRVLICSILSLAAMLGFAVVASSALAETALAAAPTTAPVASMAGVDFIDEGIPIPIVDGYVDGWFRYVGDGKFVCDSGRAFFWRDGQFVNPDGTTMTVPTSSGVDHQPNAQDLAEAKVMAVATQTTGDVTEGLVAPALAPSSWAGNYLHQCQLQGQILGKYGNQADILIHDRSVGFAEYYGIGFSTVSYPGGSYQLGFQICDLAGTNTRWHPMMHRIINGSNSYFEFTSYEFNTSAGGSVTKTLKMDLGTDGRVYPYMNGTLLYSSGVYWGPPTEIAHHTRCETGAEIGSDSGVVVPHDPANRHSNIKTKNSAGTWSLQTSTCLKINTLWNNVTHTSGTGLYLHWTITNYYDWQGRP